MNIPDREKFIYDGRCGFTASNSTLKNGTTLTIEVPVKIVNSRIIGNTFIGAFTNIRDNCLLRSVTSIGRFTSVAGGGSDVECKSCQSNYNNTCYGRKCRF